jgi:hypothetical protein
LHDDVNTVAIFGHIPQHGGVRQVQLDLLLANSFLVKVFRVRDAGVRTISHADFLILELARVQGGLPPCCLVADVLRAFCPLYAHQLLEGQLEHFFEFLALTRPLDLEK